MLRSTHAATIRKGTADGSRSEITGSTSYDGGDLRAATAQSWTRLSDFASKPWAGSVLDCEERADQTESGFKASWEPITKLWPSGAQAAQVTGSSWCLRTRVHRPL